MGEMNIGNKGFIATDYARSSPLYASTRLTLIGGQKQGKLCTFSYGV